MTILVNKQAAAAAPTLLAQRRAQTPRGEYVELPMFGQVWIELAGEMVVDEIEGAVHAAMGRLKLEPNILNAMTYESRRLALTLAWAVRHPDPDKRDVRAGTQDEWIALDIDLLSACGLVYQDVRVRLSPVQALAVDAEQFEQIRLAHEKKNPMLLRSFGLGALSLYLASTDAPPASSPTTPSLPGES